MYKNNIISTYIVPWYIYKNSKTSQMIRSTLNKCAVSCAELSNTISWKTATLIRIAIILYINIYHIEITYFEKLKNSQRGWNTASVEFLTGLILKVNRAVSLPNSVLRSKSAGIWADITKLVVTSLCIWQYHNTLLIMHTILSLTHLQVASGCF